jgi:hypothetical protein
MNLFKCVGDLSLPGDIPLTVTLPLLPALSPPFSRKRQYHNEGCHRLPALALNGLAVSACWADSTSRTIPNLTIRVSSTSFRSHLSSFLCCTMAQNSLALEYLPLIPEQLAWLTLGLLCTFRTSHPSMELTLCRFVCQLPPYLASSFPVTFRPFSPVFDFVLSQSNSLDSHRSRRLSPLRYVLLPGFVGA